MGLPSKTLCVLYLSVINTSYTKEVADTLAKVISSGCSGARCEEYCLTLRIAKMANPVSIQRAVAGIELNNEQPMSFNPALPALRAFPG